MSGNTGATTALDSPRVLTPAAQAKIVQLLTTGHFLTSACQHVGITRETFYYWKKLCENGAEHAQVYADFFSACARATAVAEDNALTMIVNGMNGWQGPAWFLQRRLPKKWGNKDAAPRRAFPKDLSTLTDRELDELDREYGGKGRD